jgi:hypothetical protein
MFIFFINGVNTTPDEANANLIYLEDTISDHPNVTWNVLYNPTHGLLKSDIWDYMAQKHQERKNYDINFYTNYYINKHNIDCCESPEAFNAIKQSIKLKYIEDSSSVGKNLKGIVEQFHNRIPPNSDLSNLYVLIISHSQGNEYANQLWDYLVNGEGFSKDHISLLGIATPTRKIDANIINSNYGYVTADNDKIINISRILDHDVLPANVHIKDCKDFNCHNFISDYLGDTSIRKIICDQIGSYMNLWLNTQPLC